MSRTTLTIDPDALKAAREYARRRKQTLGQAVSELVRINHPLHEFWPDSLTVARSFEGLVQHAGGYRQATDAYLLGLAIRRKARLATFDSGVKQLGVNAGKGAHVELIE